MNEEKLFELIRDRFLPDLTLSDFQYSRYDCYSAQHKIDVELKCRRKHYDTLLLEKEKYDALIDRSKKFSTRPLYINSTPLGIYIFDLSQIKPIWEVKYLPTTTDFSNTTKIEKRVTFLHIRDSKSYEL